MYRTYELSVFGVNFETIFKEMKAFGKNEIIGLYASIIYMEHDLRILADMPAEDALKNTLEDHGIRLGNSDIWQYSLRFDTNKLAALNAIMVQRVSKLKRLYPAADMSFRIYLGKVNGKPALGLESVHEEYFDYIKSRPYIKGEADTVQTFWGEMHSLDETALGTEYNMEEILMEDIISYDSPKYKSKERRITMVIANGNVLGNVMKLDGWKETDETKNPADWIKARENVAKRLIDDLTWREILLEGTGFDPNKIPDFKKNMSKIAAPIKGILTNILK